MQEVETRGVPAESADKISPEHDVIEETADQVTVTEAEEQAKEPQTEQKTEQQKLVPETQPQRDEDMSTTPPEEVNLTICDCIRCIDLLYSYSRVIANQFKVIRLARIF